MKAYKPAALLFAVSVISAFPIICAGPPRYVPGVERWAVQEIALHSSRHYDNPFREVTLTAKFSCAGEQVNVAGFYDGDSVWKVRYMPLEFGQCSFQTASNDPEINNQSGKFD